MSPLILSLSKDGWFDRLTMSGFLDEGAMEAEGKKPNPISLARQIMQFRKEKHPYGGNYAVSVRLGHADIQDSTAIADILFALQELGYEIIKKPD